MQAFRDFASSMCQYFMIGFLYGLVESYYRIKKLWTAKHTGELKPNTRYYLSGKETEFQESDTHVPKGCVYIEEWIDPNNHRKNVVLYEGELIPHEWVEAPYDIPAKCPWVWVGDRETEIDLTKTFNKFLVPGNRIKMDLVSKLIQVHDRTDLIYLETGTFNEIKFPGDGITIEEYVDNPE